MHFIVLGRAGEGNRRMGRFSNSHFEILKRRCCINAAAAPKRELLEALGAMGAIAFDLLGKRARRRVIKM
jgi:hypothetical protein